MGREVSYINWKVYITQLINQGLIRIDYTDGFKLKMTPLSNEVLFGNRNVKLVDLVVSDSDVQLPKQKTLSKKATFAEKLLHLLKEWRLQLARQKDVPAFVIFSDKVLENIVEAKPLYTDDLISIEGIGKVKMEQYGEDILAVVRGYVLHGESDLKVTGKTYIETYDLIKKGFTPEEIAKQKNIQEITVYSHLAHLYTKGENVDLYKYVTEEEVRNIEQAWHRTGKEMALSPIAEFLTSPIAFYKIRLALAILTRKA